MIYLPLTILLYIQVHFWWPEARKMQSDVISKGTCHDRYHTIGHSLVKGAHCRSIIPHHPVLCIVCMVSKKSNKFAVQLAFFLETNLKWGVGLGPFQDYNCIASHNYYAEAILVGICECYSKFAEFEPCPSHLQNWRWPSPRCNHSENALSLWKGSWLPVC